MITTEYILQLSNVYHSGQVRTWAFNCRSATFMNHHIVNIYASYYKLQTFFTILQVEAGTCVQKLSGNVKTGVILKDVSMEVHGGELSAVLGSKGLKNHSAYLVLCLTIKT